MAGDRPPAPIGSWDQLFSKQFYTWEKRGRGWQTWTYPVELEPVFYPFYCYKHNARGVVDDGHRLTFVSRLARLIFKSVGGQDRPIPEPAQIAQREDLVEDEPDAFAPESPLIEFQLALPSSFKSHKDPCEQFLLSLANIQLPLSFEIIGLADEIVLQIVCRKEDSWAVRQELDAYFPEAVIMEDSGFLLRHWSPNSETPDDLFKDGLVVDFGLAEEFLLPLRVSRNFDPDPLIGIVGALSEMAEDEVGVFQVLFRPVNHPWAENVYCTVIDPNYQPFFGSSPNLVNQAKQKIDTPLYAVIVRVAAKAPSKERGWQIVRGLAGALTTFNNAPTGNKLVPLSNDDYKDEDHIFALLTRLTYRGGMLLNSDELISLIHLPSASVRSSNLRREVGKTKAPPALASGHSLILGENIHNGRCVEVSLPANERLRHMHVIGISGKGKSTFLLNMILQDIEQGQGLAVLDPHGDLIEAILERIPESRWNDVVLVDPSDDEYPVGFNILSAHSELEKELLSSDLASVFRRLSTSWGDQMTSVFGNAILAFFESTRGGTLSDLRRFLVDKKFRDEFLQTVTDPEVVFYWRQVFPLLSGNPQAPILTRLDIFLRPKRIRYMVGQKENRLDFAGMMNDGKIFLAKLAQGAIGEENAFLLGTLLVSKFHQTALSRQEMQEASRRDFFLYIDEFHNFITPSMASILSGARKYHLGLILAHQELRQLGRDTDVAAAVLANPFARVCFALGDEDARKLADGFSFFEAKDLQNLERREAIGRLDRPEYDFNFRTLPLEPINAAQAAERKERIIQLSRQRYGTRRDLVEAALAKNAPDYSNSEVSKPKPQSRKESTSGTKSRPEEPIIPFAATSPQPEPEPEPEPESDATPFSPVTPPLPVYASEPTAEYRPASDHESEAGMEPAGDIGTPGTKPDKPKPLPKPSPSLGRGGPEHKTLQRKIGSWAQGMRWEASMDHEILAGEAFVDVILKKDGISIACEICKTSSISAEVSHIEKRLKAGMTYVVSVSDDETKAHKIEKAAQKKLPTQDLEKVRFVTVEGLKEFIKQIDAKLLNRVEKIRGREVELIHKVISPADSKARKARISKAIFESLQSEDTAKGKSKEKKDK